MIDNKKIEELKQEHGSIHLLEADGEAVIAREPSRTDYRKFRASIMDEKKRADAIETLLRDCVVHPNAVDLDALLGRKPGLAESLGNEVAKIAGVGAETRSRKL